MDKKVLEEAATKTVEYYFEGLSFKEAINKVLEEMGEKRMFGVHDKSICEECHYMNISNGLLRLRHCKRCGNYGEKMLPATVRVIKTPIKTQIDCPHCDEEIMSSYGEFIKAMGCEYSGDWEGRVIQCPRCEKEIEIDDVEWD